MEAVNPYESPKSKASVSASQLDSYQPKLLSVNGRIGRLRYLAYSTVASIIIGVVFALVSFVLVGLSETALAIAMGVIYLPLLVYSVILAKRRLNDLDRSGWWQLLFLVPLVNILFGLYVLLWPGTKGSNSFGACPTKNSILVILGGLILPLVFIVGILAAIAIPAYQDYVERAQQQMTQ